MAIDNVVGAKAQPSDDLVRRFEPARAVLRPLKCDGGAQCWVRDGKASFRHCASANQCLGCGGSMNLIGNEQRHAAVLTMLTAS